MAEKESEKEGEAKEREDTRPGGLLIREPKQCPTQRDARPGGLPGCGGCLLSSRAGWRCHGGDMHAWRACRDDYCLPTHVAFMGLCSAKATGPDSCLSSSPSRRHGRIASHRTPWHEQMVPHGQCRAWLSRRVGAMRLMRRPMGRHDWSRIGTINTSNHAVAPMRITMLAAIPADVMVSDTKSKQYTFRKYTPSTPSSDAA